MKKLLLLILSIFIPFNTFGLSPDPDGVEKDDYNDRFSLLPGSYVCESIQKPDAGGHIVIDLERWPQSLEEKERMLETRKKMGCGTDNEHYHCFEGWSGPFTISYEIYGLLPWPVWLTESRIKKIPKKKTFYSAFIDRGHGLDSRAEDEEITISFFFRTDLISQGETSIPQTSLRFYKGGFGYQEYLGTRLFDSSCRKL